MYNMKDLKNYILEKATDEETKEVPQSKSFTFDFAGLTNAEDTQKSLDDLASKHGLSLAKDGDKVSFTVTKDTDIEAVQDVLQQYAETLRKEPKNASDEQYAQKTKKFAETVGAMNDYLDDLEGTSSSEEE